MLEAAGAEVIGGQDAGEQIWPNIDIDHVDDGSIDAHVGNPSPADANGQYLLEARLESHDLEPVRKLDFVECARYFLNDFKLGPAMRSAMKEMAADSVQNLTVMLFPGSKEELREELERKVRAIDGVLEVHAPRWGWSVKAHPRAIEPITKEDEVRSVVATARGKFALNK